MDVLPPAALSFSQNVSNGFVHWTAITAASRLSAAAVVHPPSTATATMFVVQLAAFENVCFAIDTANLTPAAGCGNGCVIFICEKRGIGVKRKLLFGINKLNVFSLFFHPIHPIWPLADP
jgi:hypothetical protein